MLLFGLKFATSKFIFLRHFDISCGSPLYTLDRMLVWGPHLSHVPHLGLHQKQVVRLPHIDVRYERAGPLQRSKELIGLGDDSIMSLSQEREIEMVTLHEIFDHYTFLGNCPPTPPLSQHSHLLLT